MFKKKHMIALIIAVNSLHFTPYKIFSFQLNKSA